MAKGIGNNKEHAHPSLSTEPADSVEGKTIVSHGVTKPWRVHLIIQLLLYTKYARSVQHAVLIRLKDFNGANTPYESYFRSPENYDPESFISSLA